MAGNKRSQITVKPIDADAKALGHALQANNLVALEKLCIGAQTHLLDIPASVLIEVAVLRQELGLDVAEGFEEVLVVARVEAVDHLGKGCKVNLRLRLVFCVRAGGEGGQIDDGRSGGSGLVKVHFGGVAARVGGNGARESGQTVVRVIRADDGADFGRVDNAGLEVAARKGDGARQDGVNDEGGVGAELSAGEGAERVEEKRGGKRVGADGEEVQALVCL